MKIKALWCSALHHFYLEVWKKWKLRHCSVVLQDCWTTCRRQRCLHRTAERRQSVTARRRGGAAQSKGMGAPSSTKDALPVAHLQLQTMAAWTQLTKANSLVTRKTHNMAHAYFYFTVVLGRKGLLIFSTVLDSEWDVVETWMLKKREMNGKF